MIHSVLAVLCAFSLLLPAEETEPFLPEFTDDTISEETVYGDFAADALANELNATIAYINGVDLQNKEDRVVVYGTTTLGELVEQMQEAPEEGFWQISGFTLDYASPAGTLVSLTIGEELVWNRVLGYTEGYSEDSIYSCVINFIPDEEDNTEYLLLEDAIAAYLEELGDDVSELYQAPADRISSRQYAATDFYLEDNYLYVTYEDGYTQCVGPVKGADGEDGLDGAQGDPGSDAGYGFGVVGVVFGLVAIGLFVFDKVKALLSKRKKK